MITNTSLFTKLDFGQKITTFPVNETRLGVTICRGSIAYAFHLYYQA